MTIEEITREYFEKHLEAKGLVHDDTECGCPREDLFPCMGPSMNCCVASFTCETPHCQMNESGGRLFCKHDPATCDLKAEAIKEDEE